MTWSGPLPPPGALQQFDQIIPNGADRILKMVEAEQAHRISHDQKLLSAMAGDTKRGQWIGGAISATSIAGAIVSILLHAHPTVSIALIGVPVLGMIRAIVASKTNSK
jgi:uncharacterized membrane protein